MLTDSAQNIKPQVSDSQLTRKKTMLCLESVVLAIAFPEIKRHLCPFSKISKRSTVTKDAPERMASSPQLSIKIIYNSTWLLLIQ